MVMIITLCKVDKSRDRNYVSRNDREVLCKKKRNVTEDKFEYNEREIMKLLERERMYS